MKPEIIFEIIFPNKKIEGLLGIELGEEMKEVRKALGAPKFERSTQFTYLKKLEEPKDQIKFHVIFDEKKEVKRISLHYLFNKKNYKDDSDFVNLVNFFVNTMNEKIERLKEEKEKGEKHSFRYWYDTQAKKEVEYFSSIYEEKSSYKDQHILKINLKYK